MFRTPSGEHDDLADAAPRSVDATVSLDGDAVSQTYPVVAENGQVGTLSVHGWFPDACLTH